METQVKKEMRGERKENMISTRVSSLFGFSLRSLKNAIYRHNRGVFRPVRTSGVTFIEVNETFMTSAHFIYQQLSEFEAEH